MTSLKRSQPEIDLHPEEQAVVAHSMIAPTNRGEKHQSGVRVIDHSNDETVHFRRHEGEAFWEVASESAIASTKKILSVDDDRLQLKAIQKLLKSSVYNQIYTLRSDLAAVITSRMTPGSLIISDQNMIDSSNSVTQGTELALFTAKYRLANRIKFVLSSGDNPDQIPMLSELLYHGIIDDFLPKGTRGMPDHKTKKTPLQTTVERLMRRS